MWSLAAELVEKVEDGMGGDWNEGLMEVKLNSLLAGGSRRRISHADSKLFFPHQLGATVCKPTEADCGPCPLSSSCVAFKEVSSFHSCLLSMPRMTLLKNFSLNTDNGSFNPYQAGRGRH